MNTKVLTLATGISFGIILTGCATVFGGGSKQDMMIKSSSNKSENFSLHYIDDKNITSNAIQTFQTPANITIGRENKDIVIKNKDNKCEELRVKREINPWFFGDVAALSLLSTTVDSVTGAIWEYDNNITIECQE